LIKAKTFPNPKDTTLPCLVQASESCHVQYILAVTHHPINISSISMLNTSKPS